MSIGTTDARVKRRPLRRDLLRAGERWGGKVWDVASVVPYGGICFAEGRDREPWKEAAPVCEIATSPTGVSAPRNDSKRKRSQSLLYDIVFFGGVIAGIGRICYTIIINDTIT